MVREDILGGLNSALERGQSLKQAMMSFYNAGYPKAEIEEAARVLKSGGLGVQQISSPQAMQSPLTVQQKPSVQSSQKISSYGNLQTQEPVQQVQTQKQVLSQNVSSYEKEQHPRGKLAIIVLVIILFLLLATFGAVFFFRQEIINFFSS